MSQKVPSDTVNIRETRPFAKPDHRIDRYHSICIKHILLFDRYHSRYHSILYQTHSPISFFLRLGFVSNTFLHIMLSFFRYHSSFQTHSSVFHRKAISFYVGWTLFRYHSSISFLRLVLVAISFFNIILKAVIPGDDYKESVRNRKS